MKGSQIAFICYL